jgi:hypothetical protein
VVNAEVKGVVVSTFSLFSLQLYRRFHLRYLGSALVLALLATPSLLPRLPKAPRLPHQGRHRWLLQSFILTGGPLLEGWSWRAREGKIK